MFVCFAPSEAICRSALASGPQPCPFWGAETNPPCRPLSSCAAPPWSGRRATTCATARATLTPDGTLGGEGSSQLPFQPWTPAHQGFFSVKPPEGGEGDSNGFSIWEGSKAGWNRVTFSRGTYRPPQISVVEIRIIFKFLQAGCFGAFCSCDIFFQSGWISRRAWSQLGGHPPGGGLPQEEVRVRTFDLESARTFSSPPPPQGG